MEIVTSGKMDKDGNTTVLVVLVSTVRGSVYQTLPFIKVFWFLIQER